MKEDNKPQYYISNKEHSIKNGLNNDLTNKDRYIQSEINWIRMKLEKAEQSGFTSDSRAQILKQSKDMLNG